MESGQGLSGLNSGTETPASEEENHDEEALSIHILNSTPMFQCSAVLYFLHMWDMAQPRHQTMGYKLEKMINMTDQELSGTAALPYAIIP